MKKNSIYIGVAVLAGLLLGYLIFGNNSEEVAIKDYHPSAEVSAQIWTCSMHPQIKQSESGDCPICGMDLIPAQTTSDGLGPDQFSMTENAMALANIQTSMVGKMGLDTGALKLSGRIKENEEANTAQVTHFSGRIEQLLINSEGEQVYKGQRIAVIYSPELVAAQQELLTALALKKEQPALYKAVRNKLKLRKLSEEQINQIESSGKIKETFPIHSQVTGVVSEKMVNEGNHIDRGQVLFKTTNLSTVWASFDAYENQIPLLKKGQKITIKTNAYPNMVFDAVISFIDPVLNTKTRTITVRAVLQNNNSIFKPGMFVEGMVCVTGQIIDSAVTIPKSAVLWTGKRSVVYVKSVSDQPVFEMRAVTLGNANNDSYQILDGLSKGEEIVTNGTFSVDAAAQLQGKKSMMNDNRVTDISGTKEKNKGTILHNSFQEKLRAALSTYFLLKDALVASNANDASRFSEKMLNKLKDINTNELKQKELKHVHTILEMLEGITKTNNISNQRDYFVNLNTGLAILVRSMNLLQDDIYIQKCPMVDNNNGAIWLSKEKEVRNPYYGDQMLTCGSVIDTLKKI
ncbi:efflux RND transporter periplasmic adaptor subunit [Aquimarina sp. M1]